MPKFILFLFVLSGFASLCLSTRKCVTHCKETAPYITSWSHSEPLKNLFRNFHPYPLGLYRYSSLYVYIVCTGSHACLMQKMCAHAPLSVILLRQDIIMFLLLPYVGRDGYGCKGLCLCRSIVCKGFYTCVVCVYACVCTCVLYVCVCCVCVCVCVCVCHHSCQLTYKHS